METWQQLGMSSFVRLKTKAARFSAVDTLVITSAGHDFLGYAEYFGSCLLYRCLGHDTKAAIGCLCK